MRCAARRAVMIRGAEFGSVQLGGGTVSCVDSRYTILAADMGRGR
jgi:hypothetical protein